MFVTSELHVFINDIIPIDSTYHSKCRLIFICDLCVQYCTCILLFSTDLIGISTPFLYFSKKV